ncbi:hypothetical protein ACIGEP_14705 [Microbacterium sp. NPDC077663]|uniref:hypothetical protein n=1 Tax=Microbacterium sp. NPDC077663 TaxID=3364189 RepID=UPI0037CAAC59
MQVFRPWDADDEEYAERRLVREQIPATLVAPLLVWLKAELGEGYSYVPSRVVHHIESALQFSLGFPSFQHEPEPVHVITKVMEKYGRDKGLLRLTDLMLSTYRVATPQPHEVVTLGTHMDLNASAVQVVELDGVYRLGHRSVDGVPQAAESAATSHIEAGVHLVRAWSEAQLASPNVNVVMAESILAVESAAGPKVTPAAKMYKLGQIRSALESQRGWGLAFALRDDSKPDHLAMLLGMLDTLIVAQTGRHPQPNAAAEADAQQARGHVQLAATLVQWFSTDVVRRLQEK